MWDKLDGGSRLNLLGLSQAIVALVAPWRMLRDDLAYGPLVRPSFFRNATLCVLDLLRLLRVDHGQVKAPLELGRSFEIERARQA